MAVFIILSFCVINTLCYESGSSELNRIEFTPLYETIIYSDIADIIKDYENNANPPIETLTNKDDDSESDENIEDLLSEYQHYLEKAHKQRRNYVDKSKTKNKVPLLQRDRYSKSLAAKTNKHDDFYYNPNTIPFPKTQFNAPLDFLIPINMMRSSPYYGEPIKQQVDPAKQFPTDQVSSDVKMLNLPPVMPSLIREKIPSSCYCEADTFPCECGCKQCLIALEPSPRRKQIVEEKSKATATEASSNKDVRPMSDNTINIKIKVDVQFPQVQQGLGEILMNKTNEKTIERGSISKESNINLPFPFFGFPFPLEMYDLQKTNKNTAPIHKITIHRKKKSKAGSNGKRHRKKVITYHDLKLEQEHSTSPNVDESYKTSDSGQKIESNIKMNQANDWNNTQIVEQANTMYTDIFIDKTTKLPIMNNTKTDDNIYFMVNISNSFDNTTEDVHKNENSIETDFTRGNSNASTEEPSLRKKREVTKQNSSAIEISDRKKISQAQKISINLNETIKKTDKSLPDDDELLYWPNNSKGLALVNSKNITSLILDRESNKEKLNLSAETIRHNRSKALEEAIFGKVDWNDVGTVAPAFMSFMGKYIRGALSFCSDSICHSMKCAEMMCVHRTCKPTDRTNNRGHCAGSNTTDSVASMESIMDLPSNIALETVDILQQKMLGKLFGKATISIGSKCVTFTASRKSFTKVKCTPKELDATGHCSISKITKIA
ncbi:uncharacterized protein LOC133524363 [Cydia pomonella]|uniref:uncharacterized protein LOC133524363 n=1 Tax=Cydia pomonella TaxID=82600 RepID=UPI002ADD4EA9|nr:uncharacterized protein LOC133524363 [Cydia pomonella]